MMREELEGLVQYFVSATVTLDLCVKSCFDTNTGGVRAMAASRNTYREAAVKLQAILDTYQGPDYAI